MGAGMEFDGRQVALQEAEVLKNKGVDTGVVELANHGHGGFKLIVEEEGVDGGEDLGAVEVGITHEGVDIIECVGGGGAGAEGRRADIERVGAVVDGLAPELEVLRR